MQAATSSSQEDLMKGEHTFYIPTVTWTTPTQACDGHYYVREPSAGNIDCNGENIFYKKVSDTLSGSALAELSDPMADGVNKKCTGPNQLDCGVECVTGRLGGRHMPGEPESQMLADFLQYN